MSKPASRGAPGKKAKEVPKTAAELKKEKLQHDFQSVIDASFEQKQRTDAASARSLHNQQQILNHKCTNVLTLHSSCCSCNRFNTDEAKSARLEIRQLRAEIENETRLLNDFQQQKNKVDQFHELAKRKREDLKMDLRNSLRQKQDLEEKQSYELKLYKSKVKHLLHEQQSGMTDLRIDHESASALVGEDQRLREHHLSVELRSLKVSGKSQEVQHDSFLKDLKLNQEKNILALRIEFERKAQQLKDHYEKKSKTLRDESDELRRQEVTRIELKKNTHVADLMAKHKRKFEKIKKYYADITHANLELIKNLKVSRS